MGSETDYYPALAPLSWLFGVWESIEAEVFYPSMSATKYFEVVEFIPSAVEALIEYKSNTWHSEKKTKLHCETGYIRVDPESGKIALYVAHHFGLIEISEGSVENKELSFESRTLSQVPFLTCQLTKKIERKLALKGEEIHGSIRLQTDRYPLQDHLYYRYKKKQ